MSAHKAFNWTQALGDMPRKMACRVCSSDVEIPDDVMDGELVSCPTCGQKYQVIVRGGDVELKEVALEAEDWGE